jgi:hypothetical protein
MPIRLAATGAGQRVLKGALLRRPPRDAIWHDPRERRAGSPALATSATDYSGVAARRRGAAPMRAEDAKMTLQRKRPPHEQAAVSAVSE